MRDSRRRSITGVRRGSYRVTYPRGNFWSNFSVTNLLPGNGCPLHGGTESEEPAFVERFYRVLVTFDVTSVGSRDLLRPLALLKFRKYFKSYTNLRRKSVRLTSER